tara:strand:+ start:159 stop:449 length:291 start_codon:yes stop_codon:yes gene_type:complete
MVEVSNCCGAAYREPGWPDVDICSCCNEHSEPITQEEPSIETFLKASFDWAQYKKGIIENTVKAYGSKDNAIIEMHAKIKSLQVEADSLREMIEEE